MKSICLSILFLFVGIFALITGTYVSKDLEQKISLIITGAFFIITAVSIFLNRKNTKTD